MAIDTDEKTVEWLNHFGYLDTKTPTKKQHNAAVSRMQQVYGLVEDAVAGPVTRRAMGLFRCARSDSALTQPGFKALKLDDKNCRWQKSDITYTIGDNFQLAGNRNKSLAIIREGFKIYEPLTGLKFTEIDDWHAADIQIGRGRGRKWDFDGPGNVLAWAYMPCGEEDSQLLAMFDDTEPWNLKTYGPGVIMLAVWLHELGHLLGLDHSDDPADLMAPYYNPQIIYPQMGERIRLAKNYELEEVPKPPQPVPGLPYGAYLGDAVIVLNEDGNMAVNIKDVRAA